MCSMNTVGRHRFFENLIQKYDVQKNKSINVLLNSVIIVGRRTVLFSSLPKLSINASFFFAFARFKRKFTMNSSHSLFSFSDPSNNSPK